MFYGLAYYAYSSGEPTFSWIVSAIPFNSHTLTALGLSLQEAEAAVAWQSRKSAGAVLELGQHRGVIFQLDGLPHRLVTETKTTTSCRVIDACLPGV